jgi:hypothetical protein
MTAKELFGVGVRLSGLLCIVMSLPGLISFNYGATLGAAGGVAAGLILITRADLIVQLSYPQDFREKDSREI